MLCRNSRSIVPILAALLAVAGAAFAPGAPAQKIAAPPPERWVRPQLVVANGADLPVRMQQVAVKSEVSGRLAVTEISMQFFNPNSRTATSGSPTPPTASCRKPSTRSTKWWSSRGTAVSPTSRSSRSPS